MTVGLRNLKSWAKSFPSQHQRTINTLYCRFHQGQCWWRRIQKLALKDEYKDSDIEIGNLLKLFFCLPCFHPADVEEYFVENLMAEASDEERVVQFMDYVLDNYIDISCKFPPDMWAAHSPA